MVAAPAAGDGASLRIGEISYLVADIYTPEEVTSTTSLLRFVRRSMNALHIGTRHHVIRRELLFKPGDPLDPSLLAETERNLRNLGFLNNVSVTPVDTLPDGSVDIEVRAQETWSLETQFSYSRGSEGSQRWNVFLSDGNFFGHGTQVGLGMGENEDYRYAQFNFRQRRLFGSRWQLAYSRAGLGDGTSESLLLQRPLYAQDDPFGLEWQVWRDAADHRFYLSNAGPAGEDPGRTGSLYSRIPRTSEGTRLNCLIRISRAREGRIWRLGGGFELRWLDFEFTGPDLELSDGRVVPHGFLSNGDTPLTREDGLHGYPFLMLQTQGRTWTTTRFLLQYGTVEDVPLDPTWQLRAGPTGVQVGSTTTAGDHFQMDYEFRDWSRLGSGFLLLRSEGLATLGSAAERSAAFWLLTGWIGTHGSERNPRQTKLFVEGAWGDRLLGTEAFVLGLNQGLRTLDFDGMAGDRLVRWNVEHGVVFPFELLGFYRTGLAVYYGGGLAWWQDEDRDAGDIRHELGVGIRFGSTRSGRVDVARLDLTWALDEPGGPVLTAVTRGLF